jgi:rod shape-determining protein MreB and related proteins
VGDGLVTRARDLAVDLGTANTRVVRHGEGIVYDEPSVVAVNTRTGDVLAVGGKARALMQEAPPHVAVTRPLERGVITDYELAEQMIRLVLRTLGVSRLFKPRVLVCVPSSLTPVERRAVEEAVTSAGGRSVSLVDEPLAAAIGAGLPVQDARGSMIVDIGGSTSEMAMVALGGVVTTMAIPVGGFDMDEAIQRHIRKRYGVAVGDRVAERVKIELGSAYPAADARPMEVHGRALSSAMPTTVLVTPEEVREVLTATVEHIAQTTRDCLSESPPELAHDVLETGLFLTGGGALLRGLDMRLAQECEVPVHLTELPMATVAIGAGRLLDYLPAYRGSQTRPASAHR